MRICAFQETGVEPQHALRSEEHTSELQSPCNLVCRLLLEKKKIHHVTMIMPRHPVRGCSVIIVRRCLLPSYFCLINRAGTGIFSYVNDLVLSTVLRKSLEL